MTAVLTPSRVHEAESQDLADDRRFVFYEVTWEFYEQILNAVSNRHIFVTYFDGTLEIMSPFYKHDLAAEILGQFVRLLAQELRVPMKGAGSTTLRRKGVEAGIEPDRCYYVQNVQAILGKQEINLDQDPPPDLAIEIEISHRIGQRIDVYRALRIPELWRYAGDGLHVLVLTDHGYVEQDHSIAFPTLSIDQIAPWIEASRKMNDVEWTSAVVAWIRKNLARSEQT